MERRCVCVCVCVCACVWGVKGTYLGTVLLVSVLNEGLEDRPPPCRAHGVCAKGVEVDPLLHDRRNLGRGDDCGQRESVADALSSSAEVVSFCTTEAVVLVW